MTGYRFRGYDGQPFSGFSPRHLAATSSKKHAPDARGTAEHRMIGKLLLQTLIWMIAMGALLFVPAGTWR